MDRVIDNYFGALGTALFSLDVIITNNNAISYFGDLKALFKLFILKN